MPHPHLLNASASALLVIDVQDKLLVKIPDAAALVRNAAFLVDAAQLLGVPVSATEQYPRGLGPTTQALAQRIPERPEKVAFSSCAIPAVTAGFHQAGRRQIVLAGMETHVCVLHTAFDLLAQEFAVYLPIDAVSARYRIDHDTALRRLEKAGAILTTCEGVVFEWMGGADHPQFKKVSQLIQERMKALQQQG